MVVVEVALAAVASVPSPATILPMPFAGAGAVTVVGRACCMVVDLTPPGAAVVVLGDRDWRSTRIWR